MPSYEPTDEEIAALTRETDEEEAHEWRKQQALRSETVESSEARHQAKRQRERAGDWDHNHAWELQW